MDVKKIEHEIIKEAKNEENILKDALKDLSHTEKTVVKTHKAATKADHSLEKSEKKEQSALGKVHEATHAHDIALSTVHKAQNDLEMTQTHHAKVQEALAGKKSQVDAAIKQNQVHTRERNDKIIALHGPGGGDEASRVIPQHSDSEPL
ncbi:hypothetical protein BYT27DRAFT_6717449 [Phlegmacium glaucopus]|nr:hypothetical protein BYT27DRAFT_6717449 [Phlegmacium glaucopus]